MTSRAPAPAPTPGFDSAQQRRLKTGSDATPFGHVIIYNELITFNAHVQRPVEHGAQLNVTLTRSTEHNRHTRPPTHTQPQCAKTAATTTSENNNNNCQCGQLSASCLSTQLGSAVCGWSRSWSWSRHKCVVSRCELKLSTH